MYEIKTLNDVFINAVNASPRHILQYHLTQIPQVDSRDIAFLAEAQPSIGKVAGSTPHNIQNIFNVNMFYNKNRWNSRNSTNTVSTSTTAPSRKSKQRLMSPGISPLHTSNANMTINSTPSLSSSMSSVNPPFCEVCWNPSYRTPKCHLMAPDSFRQLTIFRSWALQKMLGEKLPSNVGRFNYRYHRFRGRWRRSFLSDKNTHVSRTQQNDMLTEKN